MDHVVGMSLEEGDALLDRLIDHATSERFVYRHRWRPHDVVLWDNRCTMHKASDDYDERREMHRVLVEGPY
jgi:taurine dioxygenase